MANENFIGWQPYSFTAGGTISKGNVLMLNGTTSKSVVRTTAITDLAVGVALADASSGDLVPVMPIGPVCKVLAAGPVACNAEVMPHGSTAGRVDDAAGATARSIGVALEAAGADGDMIEVMLLSCPKGPANS
jgi:hypothetical protein